MIESFIDGLFINKYGTKRWYKNNFLHREDGPAIEWSNGDKSWYQNGERHRLDGPAVENINGHKSWYYEGEWIKVSSQKEFEKIINLKVFW